MLHHGERVGGGGFPVFDVAVDPLEGTKLCAAGAGGAMATIALAEEGSLWSPGPDFYMLKLVVGPRAREAIDVARSPEENVLRVARALGKALVDLRVVVLDKPRHRDLIERLRMVGVRLELPTDGDVGGALQALLEDGGADLLIGNGELLTAVQEGLKVTVVLVVNHGYQSIHGLQLGALGESFGNEFRARSAAEDRLSGEVLDVDYAANAASFGCATFRAESLEELREALDAAREQPRPVVVVCAVEPRRLLLASGVFWDLGVPQFSDREGVRERAHRHLERTSEQRPYL
jgi:hypothetical protein